MEPLTKLLLHEKPAGILQSLAETEKTYASKLAKANDCTYTHALKILEQFQNHGLVEFEKQGRIKYVKLTQAGEDAAHELTGLIRHLERAGTQAPADEQTEEGQ